MYIVMTSAAHMPASMRGAKYRNVVVVRLTPEYAASGCRPKMISNRARGVDHIVEHFGHHFVGKTPRSAYYKALAEAEVLAWRLNRQIVVPKPVARLWRKLRERHLRAALG